MPKLKVGRTVTYQPPTKMDMYGKAPEPITVLVESIDKENGEFEARFPDGSIQTLLIKMVILEVGPSFFQLVVALINKLKEHINK